MSGEWCTIESDPGVFTELIGMFGVQRVAVEEIYSLEPGVQAREKSYGLVFLFKWKPELAGGDRETVDSQNVPDLFFARQIVTNACATQAILSVLMNTEDVDLGEDLTQFRSFTGSFDSETKGIAIGNSDSMRTAHNSFARPEPFLHEKAKPSTPDEGDAYHFIAYVPHNGSVYELDGLQQGPIYLGSFEGGDDWVNVAKPAIEERMSRYSASETHFALLSVGEKKSSVLEAQIHRLEQQGDDMSASEADTLAALKESLSEEGRREALQRAENVRRRHNYVPFILELLKSMAEKQALEKLYGDRRQRK